MTTKTPTTNSIRRTGTHITGLSAAQVQDRIQRGEVNRFEARGGRSYIDIFRHNVFNVFNIVLFAMLLIVLLSQDYWTVLFAGFSVVTNSLVGTVQEINAKRKLDELADLAPKTVQVMRDGQIETIPNDTVVIDEVILIQPGERIVVDGKVIHSDSLEVDESQVTGESDAVHKQLDNPITSGSFCIAGSGLMIAEQIGAKSTVNRLTNTAKVYKNTLTPTQKKIATIVKLALMILVIFGPMLMIAGFRTDEGFIQTVKNMVVFSTSLVPQGLVLASTLALTIGAVNITRHQTLIQRVNAVESMANVTVLCFDKTGTLTENRLAVDKILPVDNIDEATISQQLKNYVGNLSHQNTTATAISHHYALDESQLDELDEKNAEIPFTSARKWGAMVFSDGTYYLGAPERVIGGAHGTTVMDYASEGYRVLAFAKSVNPPSPEGHDLDKAQMTPLALIVISDQVRHDSKATLEAFMALDVRPKVISGDSVQTVRAVAERAGMDVSVAYTGEQLDAMPDSILEQAVLEADVFARVEPETKKRIIAALRRQGHYVAMVGDGVNDVPALKEADLAIAMNAGAQITKDVADIVLLNNAMSTLPLAFEEGTRITQTLFGSTKMFLTKNVYNTLLFIFVYFMALPFPITPIQISWAAFGTVNIPGGLLAIGLIRPNKIKGFRDDVFDYILTAGLISAIGIAFTYLVTYRYVDENLLIARSTTTLLFILYSLMIFLFVCGIDVAQPRTYFRYPLATVITFVLTGGALGAATLFPDIFEFQWPPIEILGLVLLVFLLCSIVVSVGMRKRSLLHDYYTLTQPDVVPVE
ncbi:MAG: HAD-IC family P-type ATPase [Aggregatilineales bacterium]